MRLMAVHAESELANCVLVSCALKGVMERPWRVVGADVGKACFVGVWCRRVGGGTVHRAARCVA